MPDLIDPSGAGPLPGDQVAAACYRVRDGALQVLLVRSSAGRRIFPKGKVEAGEDPWESARREAEEEAGVVRSTVTPEPLTAYWHGRTAKKRGRQVTVYLVQVAETGPRHERGRRPRWYGFDDALDRLARRRRDHQALELQRVLHAVRAHVEGRPPAKDP